MAVNWNGHLLPEMPAWLQEVRRGWWYGDGLFETIRMFEGWLPWVDRHWQRLHSGLLALGYNIPEGWNAGFWDHAIRKIATGNARIRLTVWRGGGGWYTPEDDVPQFIISATPLDDPGFVWQESGLRIGLASDIFLPADGFSAFKTLNGPRYVAAAIQARRKGWDDALLLNGYGRVAEATGSNVFWWEADTLCTPPLSEGCVAGTARAVCLEIARRNGLAVMEKASTFAAVQAADEAFLTNAISGIRPIGSIDGRSLSSSKTKNLFELMAASVYT